MPRSRVVLLIAFLTGLCAGWGVLELTEPPGPGLDPDAVSYLGAGISAAHGYGFRIPEGPWNAPDTTSALAHFPPGFPALIATGVRAGLDARNAARFIQAASAAIAAIAVSLTAGVAGGPLAALTAAVLVLLTPAMIVVHASVLSEPLFLALVASFTLVMARTPPGGSNLGGSDPGAPLRRLALLTVLAAAAALVRYAGLALVGAIGLDTLLAHRQASIGRRLRNALLTMLLPVVPFGWWTLSRPARTEGVAVRHAGLYLDGLRATLGEGALTMGRWLAPVRESETAWRVMPGAIAVLVALVVLARRAWPATPEPGRQVVRSVGIVVASYLGMVLTSRVLADGMIPLDDRLLSPVMMLGALVMGVLCAVCLTDARLGRARRMLVAGLLASWLWGASDVGRWWWMIYTEDGGDFASRDWALSPTLAQLNVIPPGTPIYTNWPAAIWFHTGRASRFLPSTPDSAVARRWGALIKTHGGVALVFTTESGDVRTPLATLRAAGLVPRATFADGALWGIAPEP